MWRENTESCADPAPEHVWEGNGDVYSEERSCKLSTLTGESVRRLREGNETQVDQLTVRAAGPGDG